jgi:hypothetical protein
MFASRLAGRTPGKFTSGLIETRPDVKYAATSEITILDLPQDIQQKMDEPTTPNRALIPIL